MVNGRRFIFGMSVLLAMGLGWGLYRWAMSALVRQCREFRNQRRWEELDARTRLWTSWQPGSADAWLLRADAAQHLDRFTEAAEYLGQVPVTSGKYLSAQVARAQLLFGPADLPNEGAATSLKILEIEPRHQEIRSQLIKFYAVTLQRVALRKQIREAIQRQTEPREAYVFLLLLDTLRLAGAADLNERWHQVQTDEELFLVGSVLQRDERLVKSSSSAESSDRESEKRGLVAELLKRFPQNLNLLSYQIELEISLGNRAEVVRWLSLAPVEAEDDHRFWRYKGWVHSVRREFPDAENAYKKALSIHPLDWQTRHKLAEMYRVQGKSKEVAPLEAQVSWANALREWVPDVPQVEKAPNAFLLEIGGYARACGDEQVAAAIERRLGALPKSPSRESTTRKRNAEELQK